MSFALEVGVLLLQLTATFYPQAVAYVPATVTAAVIHLLCGGGAAAGAGAGMGVAGAGCDAVRETTVGVLHMWRRSRSWSRSGRGSDEAGGDAGVWAYTHNGGDVPGKGVGAEQVSAGTLAKAVLLCAMYYQ